MTKNNSPQYAYDPRPVALVLVAKQPTAGRVKTRLTPMLSMHDAAAIYTLFLQHIRAMSEQLAATMPGINLVLLFDPPESAVTWNQWTLWRKIPQTCGGLGERLESGLRTIMDQSLSGCIFIGADAPELDADHIKWTVDEIRRSRYAMIPAHDGGYVLIGIPSGSKSLFCGISFSTPLVAAQTRQAATRTGMVISELPPLHDIDTHDDLIALLQRLRTTAVATSTDLRHQVAEISGIQLPKSSRCRRRWRGQRPQ